MSKTTNERLDKALHALTAYVQKTKPTNIIPFSRVQQQLGRRTVIVAGKRRTVAPLPWNEGQGWPDGDPRDH